MTISDGVTILNKHEMTKQIIKGLNDQFPQTQEDYYPDNEENRDEKNNELSCLQDNIKTLKDNNPNKVLGPDIFNSSVLKD